MDAPVGRRTQGGPVIAIALLAALATGLAAIASPSAAATPLQRATAPEMQRVNLLQRIEAVRRGGTSADAAALLPLLHAEDRLVSEQAEIAIRALWERTGNGRLDRLLRTGVHQLGQRRIPQAIRTFSRIIDERPDFAEAWNKRATARYLVADNRGALDDGLAALGREPDHFATLASIGHAYYRLDQPDRAAAYWRRALVVNPNLEAVRRSLEAVERRRPGARPRIIA